MRMQLARHSNPSSSLCSQHQKQAMQVSVCCQAAHAPARLRITRPGSSPCMVQPCSPTLTPCWRVRHQSSPLKQLQGLQFHRKSGAYTCHASQEEPNNLQQSPEGAADKPQEAASVQQETQPGEEVVEAAAVEPEFSRLSEADMELIDVLPLVTMTVAQQSASIHVSLFYVFIAQAVGLSYAALYHPSALLVADAAGPVGSTLLGCAAAASLQAAGLCMHLRETFGELCTWRAQRVNAAVMLFSLTCVMSALASATASQPALTGVLVVTGLLGTLGCGHVARSCWPYGPWLQWVIKPHDMRSTWHALVMYLQRDFSTVAGTLCLVWLAVSVTGAADILFDGASWGLSKEGAISVQGHYINHLWYPYATSEKAAATLDVLRRVCGGGLIVGAATAHTLLEAAFYMRALPLMAWLKVNLLNVIRGDDRLVDLFRPPEHRFTLLTVFSVVAATVLLSVFLLRAAELGVDLNSDIALMAPLHWTAMIAVLYSCIALLRVDWYWVQGVLLQGFYFIVRIITAVFETVVLKLEWMRPHKL